MERQEIPKNKLLEILNGELKKDKDYYMCTYEDVTKLDPPDENGCNWKDALLKCSGMHAGTCKPTAFKLVEETKKLYNLE
jgi:hypothetical protein